MAADDTKQTSLDGGSKALQGDIAHILDGVQLPETSTEQLSRVMATSGRDITKVLDGVKSVDAAPEITALSDAPPAPPKDITKILEEAKLPEERTVRTSGDIPVTMVMPHEPAAISTDLIGTKQAQILREKLDPNPKKQAADMSDIPEKSTAAKSASIVVPLRTLKDDMSALVESNKVSYIRAATLEAEKKNKSGASTVEQRRSRQRTRHIFTMVFAIVMLFGIGAAALFGVYTVTVLQRNGQSQMQGSSILFAERSISFVIDNQTPDQIKQILAQARTTSTGAIGSITHIVPVISATSSDGTATQRPATLREFFNALGMHAPDDLLRALNDSFFFGIHTINKNVPIMIIPVVSYSRAFAGMLAWESTMNADLVPVFTAVPAQTRDENGLPILRTFQDSVMNNYDVRELKDDNGNIVLYYSFPTTQLLVIAESPYSFVEILSRLQAGRKL